MIQPKTQLQKINTVLGLLVSVNQILNHPATQADRLQQLQYERQKQQYLSQLTELLAMTTQPLTVTLKRSSKAV